MAIGSTLPQPQSPNANYQAWLAQQIAQARQRSAQQQQQAQQSGGASGAIAGLGVNYVKDRIKDYLASGGGVSPSSPLYEEASAIYDALPSLQTTSGAASQVASEAYPLLPGGELLPGGYGSAQAAGAPASPFTATNALAALAALHGGYNLYKDFGKQRDPISGAEMGAGIGTMIAPGIGTGIGAVLGGALGMIKSGKHEDQYARDGVRAKMKEVGAVDDGFNLTLADGSKFNIGLDGGARPEYQFSGGRRPYEVKTESPFAVQSVGWADPIAAVLTQGNPKLRSDFAGYFANAAMSNANSIEGVRANALQIMADLKLDRAALETGIQQLASAGKISQNELQAYMNSVNSMFSGKGAYVGSWDEFAARANPQPAPQPAPQPVPQPTQQITPSTQIPPNTPMTGVPKVPITQGRNWKQL